MKRIRPFLLVIALLQPPVDGHGQNNQPIGHCDFSVSVPAYTILKVGESTSWPPEICHLWGDPAAGSWTLARSGCGPPPNASSLGGIFLRSGGGCTPQINMTVTAQSNVCARQDAEFTVSATACDKTRTAAGSICILPSGEHSKSYGWNSTVPGDLGMFKGVLEPTTADFSTRTVKEVRLAVHDGCWIGGSPFDNYQLMDKFLNDGTWTIISGNTYSSHGGQGEYDAIGDIFGSFDTAYGPLGLGRTPCSITGSQGMQIICGDGSWYQYAVNPIVIQVESGGTTISRDGVPAGGAR